VEIMGLFDQATAKRPFFISLTDVGDAIPPRGIPDWRGARAGTTERR